MGTDIQSAESAAELPGPHFYSFAGFDERVGLLHSSFRRYQSGLDTARDSQRHSFSGIHRPAGPWLGSRVEELCARACKSVLLALGPALILVIAFAREILQWWLGAEYAAKSAAPLQILAVGMLFNAVAILPFSLLQSIGRPDLTAKFHLLE